VSLVRCVGGLRVREGGGGGGGGGVGGYRGCWCESEVKQIWKLECKKSEANNAARVKEELQSQENRECGKRFAQAA